MQEIHKDIFIEDNFLKSRQCKKIINAVNETMQKSQVTGVGISPVRTSSEGNFLNTYNKRLSSKIRNSISSLCKLPVENQERLSILNYELFSL